MSDFFIHTTFFFHGCHTPLSWISTYILEILLFIPLSQSLEYFGGFWRLALCFFHITRQLLYVTEIKLVILVIIKSTSQVHEVYIFFQL